MVRNGKGATAVDPQTQAPTTIIRRGGQRSKRPEVLARMPASCNVVFDVLRSSIDSRGRVTLSVREIARVAHLGKTTAVRALRRLAGAHLIARTDPGGGTQATTWQILWRSPLASFPQGTVPPTATYKPREEVSPNGTDRPPADTSKHAHPSPRALGWAAARIRETVGELPCAGERKREIVNATAAAISRALKRGEVRPGSELGELVGHLKREIVNLRRGRSGRRTSYSWAFGVVATIVEEIARARAEEAETEELLREERAAREEAAAHPVGELLAEAGVARISDLVRRMVACGNEGGARARYPSRKRRITRNDTGGRNAEEMHCLCAP